MMPSPSPEPSCCNPWKADGVLISVITVVKNDLSGLRLTAESLRDQEFTDWEWLVKDGASSDGTAQALASLQPTPRWFESCADAGIYDAMNQALEHAQGEWVMFLNAGDTLSEPNTLARVAPILRETINDWAFGSVRNIDAAGRSTGWQSASPFNPLGLAMGQTTVPHQATFIRRELLRQLGGFRLDFGTEADQELIYRASLHGPPTEIVWPIADFRVGGAGMQRPTGHFAAAMRRARREQGQRIGGNAIVDTVATVALIGKEYAKAGEAALIRRLGKGR